MVGFAYDGFLLRTIQLQLQIFRHSPDIISIGSIDLCTAKELFSLILVSSAYVFENLENQTVQANRKLTAHFAKLIILGDRMR